MDNTTSESGSIFVFFDIKFANVNAGRVVIKLFTNEVPKAAENFRALCTGEKGLGKHGKPLHYKGSKFHRVIPICMAQGGDIINGDGTAGESIYGPTFADEKSELTHMEEGMVGMSNDGPNTNQSQFYITTVPCHHLDERNVIVGKVIKGLNIIVEMSEFPRVNDEPLETIVIENCGVFKEGENWNIEERDGTEDVYPPWPNDWNVEMLDDFFAIEKAIHSIKNSGNYFFKKNNHDVAERKYKKSLRYIDWYLSHKKYDESNVHRKIVERVRNVSILNLAAVKLKKQNYKQVIKLCNEILYKERKNSKAYYRRAQAKLGIKEYDSALYDLNKAIHFCPNDKNIANLLKTTKEIKLSYLKKERAVYSKLFN